MRTVNQVCVRCVMDTSDPALSFDSNGVCSYCQYFATKLSVYWRPGPDGEARLKKLIAEMKAHGRGRPYDCVMGISGGVDSSYLAMRAKEWGLRVLAVHVDAGWNSELAVKNIEQVVKKLGFDLYTQVIDWEEMRDLHLAFLRASVPNQDIPQDHAFLAALYKLANQKGIRYVLNGGNYATESVLPRSWGYSASDASHIRDVHRRFGKRPLKSYPLLGFFEFHYYYRKIKGLKIIEPLNLMPYSKAGAIQELERRLDWRYYGGKHYESRFTKFFQAYYLPVKFGFDKRKAHLSSLVISGEISRDEAARQLAEPLYSEPELQSDKEFILKKLGLSAEEFALIMALPRRAHSDYRTNKRLVDLLTGGYRAKLRSWLSPLLRLGSPSAHSGG